MVTSQNISVTFYLRNGFIFQWFIIFFPILNQPSVLICRKVFMSFTSILPLFCFSSLVRYLSRAFSGTFFLFFYEPEDIFIYQKKKCLCKKKNKKISTGSDTFLFVLLPFISNVSSFLNFYKILEIFLVVIVDLIIIFF